MEREDILNRVDEQEQWATRALSGVREDDLFATSKVTDSEFIVALRDRIGGRALAISRRVFPSFRVVSAVASACVILLVAIIAGPRFSRNSQPQDVNHLADVATMTTETVVDSLADANVDPTELAAYLDVPDYVEGDAADSAEDSPLTDQLLALDTGTLEEVLSNLEDTEFF